MLLRLLPGKKRVGGYPPLHTEMVNKMTTPEGYEIRIIRCITSHVILIELYEPENVDNHTNKNVNYYTLDFQTLFNNFFEEAKQIADEDYEVDIK